MWWLIAPLREIQWLAWHRVTAGAEESRPDDERWSGKLSQRANFSPLSEFSQRVNFTQDAARLLFSFYFRSRLLRVNLRWNEKQAGFSGNTTLVPIRLTGRSFQLSNKLNCNMASGACLFLKICNLFFLINVFKYMAAHFLYKLVDKTLFQNQFKHL